MGYCQRRSNPLLLGSHDGFRRLSRWLADTAVDQASGASWRQVARSLFRRWQGAMQGGHEPYEEHKLYPYLRARFGVSTDALEAEHAQLNALAETVDEALERGSDTAVATSLAAYDAALHAHLEAEEDLVIPLLLALSPEEFQRLVTLRLPELLAGLGSES